MKKHRKKVIAIFAACMFAMMMMLNVNTTINGMNFSIKGYTALVNGSTGSCSSCSSCFGWGGSCKSSSAQHYCGMIYSSSQGYITCYRTNF